MEDWIHSSNMPRIELESTLLVLPFENICQLLVYLTEMLNSNQQVEMCVKAILFIIRLYEVESLAQSHSQQQLEATAQLQDTLIQLRSLMKAKLYVNRVRTDRDCEGQDRLGVNQAALTLLKRSLAERRGVFDDVESDDKRAKI